MVFLLLTIYVFGVGMQGANATWHGSVRDVDSAAWNFTATGLTTAQAHVTWSSPNGSKVVALLITAHPTCVHPKDVLKNQTGGHGSFSVSMIPGHTYEFYTCYLGSNTFGNFSLQLTGVFSWDYIFGLIPGVITVLLLILAFRPRGPELIPEI